MDLTVKEMAMRHGPLLFITCTLPDAGVNWGVEKYKLFLQRFTKKCRRSGVWPESGIRIWERHIKHLGWHSHYVFPQAGFSETLFKTFYCESGGGHIDVRTVATAEDGAVSGYLSNELGKWRQKFFGDTGRRVRSWAAWGDCRVSSTSIKVLSPLTPLFEQWGFLRKKSRWRVLCALRVASSRGAVFAANESALSQWRKVRSVCVGYGPIVHCTITVNRNNDGDQVMQLSTEAEYLGQKLETITGYSDRTKSIKKSNWLVVSFASDDGEAFIGKIYLPDGDIAAPAPLAKRGDRVKLAIAGFLQVKGATVMSLASVAPVQAPVTSAGKVK
jgi:hypothetical protein